MDIRDMTEKKLSGEKIYDGKIIRVERDEVRLPDGATAPREVVRHPGAVCVVPLTDKNEVIVVRQYRYPEAHVFTEIPAGKLEVGEHSAEHFADAARRELHEETGAVCSRLTFIGDFYSSPAILDEVIHMYLAEGLTIGEASPDDDEFLDILCVPLDELCDMIARGDIADGKTQAAVLKVKYILEKRNEKNEAEC